MMMMRMKMRIKSGKEGKKYGHNKNPKNPHYQTVTASSTNSQTTETSSATSTTASQTTETTSTTASQTSNTSSATSTTISQTSETSSATSTTASQTSNTSTTNSIINYTVPTSSTVFNKTQIVFLSPSESKSSSSKSSSNKVTSIVGGIIIILAVVIAIRYRLKENSPTIKRDISINNFTLNTTPKQKSNILSKPVENLYLEPTPISENTNNEYELASSSNTVSEFYDNILEEEVLYDLGNN
jgi:hypothetical protein